MNTPPREILYDILLDTDIPTITKYCQTSKEAGKICNDDRFWQQKFIRDRIETPPKPEGYSWKEFYLKVYYNMIRPIRVYYRVKSAQQMRGHFWIGQTVTYDKLFAMLKLLLTETKTETATLLSRGRGGKIVFTLQGGQSTACLANKPLTSPAIPANNRPLDFEIPTVMYSLFPAMSNISCANQNFLHFSLWFELNAIVISPLLYYPIDADLDLTNENLFIS